MKRLRGCRSGHVVFSSLLSESFLLLWILSVLLVSEHRLTEWFIQLFLLHSFPTRSRVNHRLRNSRRFISCQVFRCRLGAWNWTVCRIWNVESACLRRLHVSSSTCNKCLEVSVSIISVVVSVCCRPGRGRAEGLQSVLQEAVLRGSFLSGRRWSGAAQREDHAAAQTEGTFTISSRTLHALKLVWPIRGLVTNNNNNKNPAGGWSRKHGWKTINQK